MIPFPDINSDNFVSEWSAYFPLDLWYRRHYRIPIFSRAHLECNFIDIYYDFLEYRSIIDALSNPVDNNTDGYVRGSGDIFANDSMSDSDLRAMLDKIIESENVGE